MDLLASSDLTRLLTRPTLWGMTALVVALGAIPFEQSVQVASTLSRQSKRVNDIGNSSTCSRTDGCILTAKQLLGFG